MRRATLFKSSWGWMGITEAGKGIDGVALPQTSKQRAIAVLREQAPDPLVMEPSPQLALAQAQVLDYLAGKRLTFDVPLANGSSFFACFFELIMCRMPIWDSILGQQAHCQRSSRHDSNALTLTKVRKRIIFLNGFVA